MSTPDARVQEILPCPFCGAEPRRAGKNSVLCTDGVCCAAQPSIAAWNRRSPPETERLRSAQDAVWNAAVRACAEAAQNADIACHRDYQRSDDGGGTLANARNDILKLLRPDSLLTPPRDPQ